MFFKNYTKIVNTSHTFRFFCLSNVNYLNMWQKKYFSVIVVHKSNFNWEFGNTIVIDHGFYLMSLWSVNLKWKREKNSNLEGENNHTNHTISSGLREVWGLFRFPLINFGIENRITCQYNTKILDMAKRILWFT